MRELAELTPEELRLVSGGFLDFTGGNGGQGGTSTGGNGGQGGYAIGASGGQGGIGGNVRGDPLASHAGPAGSNGGANNNGPLIPGPAGSHGIAGVAGPSGPGLVV
jgi:hypothetical protein